MIPEDVRAALVVRDRGCRFPGCGLRFTDAHHVVHWASGGATNLRNCVLLCRHHHRLVHEGGWSVGWWGKGEPAFLDPHGGMHFSGRPVAPRPRDEPVTALVRANRLRGVDPDAYTASARWKREADIPARVYCRANEAV